MLHRKIALLAAASSFLVASPAVAQMEHMNMPGMKMPMPAKKKPAAKKAPAKKSTAASKAAAKKPAAKKATAKKSGSAKKPATKKPAQAESGHDMSAMPGMEMPPGQTMENMPGMTMPQGQAMPGMTMPPGQTMPGMQMPAGHEAMAPSGSTGTGTDLPAGNAPAPSVPTDHAADRVYGSDAMAMGRHHLQTFHGGQRLFQVLNNVMEYQARSGRDGYEWDSEGWYGGDIKRLWVKSQGEGQFGRPVERAEVQALYSHAIDPYFNLQGGLRYDFRPNPSRVYATAGIEGLAPNFFELEAFAFLSNKGELLARAEGYYDQRITQRLVLQPRVELNFAAQSNRELGMGAGLSDAELGLRLRYDIRREFAPYVGVQYSRAFGARRRFLRDEGENASDWTFLMGLRTWF